MRNYKNYTDNDIRNAVVEAKSIAGVLRILGLKEAGGNYATMKSNLIRLNLDTEHWNGPGWSKNKQLKNWVDYTRVTHIKPHLIKQRGRICEGCNRKIWAKQPIPLEVHHIDGNRTNNAYNNLQLLCPNCHALTDNWRGRKNGATGGT